MSATTHRLVAPLFALFALVGCINGLDEPTLVQTPRILAIVADRPEAAPGQDVHLRVLAYDPMHRELHYAFRTCFDPNSFLGLPASNGSAGMMAIPSFCSSWSAPSPDDAGLLPGAFTDQLLTLIDALPASGQFNPELIHGVLATSGGGVRVEVQLSVTGPDGMEMTLVNGAKIVGITTRATPTTNPPFIYFHVISGPSEQTPDASPVVSTYLGGADPDHPFDCIPWLTEPATVTASQPTAIGDPEHPEHCLPARHGLAGAADAQCPNRITLSPADDPSLWEESFPFYDYTGRISTGYEGAYYSWYSTGSLPDRHGSTHASLHTETTQGPSHGAPPSAIDDTIRDNTFDVPREPGTYDMWLIVRDGHLGTIGCHFPLTVTAPP